MFKKPVLYASLASLALIGCATTQSQNLTSVECRGALCIIEITVTGCDISAPTVLNVRRPFGTKKIRWEIHSAGYIFPANGIVIKKEKPAGVLKRPHLTPNGKWFILDNDHEGPGEFEYGINVLRTGDNPTVCTKDPLIVNE